MFKYTDTPSFDPATSHGALALLVGEDKSVLELGCAEGALAAHLTERYRARVTGIEISAEALERAKPHLARAILADVERDAWDGELAGERFDVILIADVLEHLYDPAAVLARAARLLKEDGRLLFSVPNIAHGDIVAKLSRGAFDYTDKGLLDDTHIRHFGERNLEPLMRSASLALTYLSATVRPLGTTEQACEISGAERAFLSAGATAHAYQLIGVAHHAAYAEREGLTLERKMPPAVTSRGIELLFRDKNGDVFSSLLLPASPFRVTVPAEADGVTVHFRGMEGTLVRGIAVSLSEEQSLLWDDNVLFEGEDALLLTNDVALQAIGGGTLSLDGKFLRAFTDEGYTAFLAETVDRYREELSHARLQGENAARALSLARRDYTDLSHRYDKIYQEYETIKNRMEIAENSLHIISTSESWRMTKPLRKFLDLLKKIGPIRFIAKALRYIRRYGIRSAFRRARSRAEEKKAAKKTVYSKADLAAQARAVFEKDVTFSILVPLYNTPKKFLLEMIDSVKAQTYAKWELCLADGSDAEHSEVGKLCLSLAEKDRRIKYKKLEKNLGISGNTNACIDMAEGNFIALFDHDDLLHPAALYEMMREIEDGADFVYTDENTFHDTPKDAYCPHFKPDFAPDTLRTNNYICHFNCFSRELLTEAGGYFRPECDGSQDYDMMLRLTEKAKKIAHIPVVLYYWRAHRGSVATDVGAKPYVIEAAHRALEDHLKRVGLEGEVLDTVVPSMYRIRYKIHGNPKVSIIIANKDHVSDLDKCLRSIEEKTTYPNYEIVIVENNSTEPETFTYYETLKSAKNIRVVTWSDGKGTFNYSAINNFGVRESTGEYVILLNNDIEIISPMWIEEMLMFAQREDVGAVGAKLYYPDDTIQHAGVGIGLLTLAGHYHRNFPRRHPGYMGRLIYAHNVSAVTAACVMLPRRVFDEVEGLDEGYAVAFNDIDLCMKIREKGYLIVFTPFAEAYHYESKSRGIEDTPEKRARFVSEIERFYSKWKPTMDKGDPYYNPNFSLDREDFSIR